MSNVLTYRPLCKVCLWQAYYLHPADINPGDLIDANGRPNTLKTVKINYCMLMQDVSSTGKLTSLEPETAVKIVI